MGLCLSKQSSSPPPLLAAVTAEAAPVRRTGVAVDVPELTLRELRKATGSFSSSRLIGKGHYATVYRASLLSGRAAAAKRLDLPASSGSWEWDDVAVLRQQIQVLSKLRHQNVVRLLGYTITGDLRVLIYEFAVMGTLHDALHGPKGDSRQGTRPAVSLSWAQRVQIALEAARGLEYMHKKVQPPATHGDVRSTNVLLFEGFRAKIGDYNVFRDAQDQNSPHFYFGLFPRGCTAPEIAMVGAPTTKKGDVYSFGVLLLELLTGRLPFDNGARLVDWAPPLLRNGRIEECIDPKIGDKYSPSGALELGKIATRCVQFRPADRPSMDIVVRVIYQQHRCARQAS